MSDYKTVNFYSKNPESLKVWEDLKRIAHEKDLFIWQVIQAGLKALEKLEQSTVIPFSPDMELSEFVKTAVQAAVNDIQETAQNETE